MFVTVFTPTYNRAHLLPRLYQSLVTQTNTQFKWLVVDDGSVDGTMELINGYIKENNISIDYIYQDNQGMHGAHNTAYENITTEFNVCVDSDDYLAENAIEIIVKNLSGLDEKMAGLVGLDATLNGDIVGSIIPEKLTKVKLNELYSVHGVTGDKKLVYKTKIMKSYPEYPIFKGERFVPLDYKYLLIDQDYFLKPVNEVLCVVEYQLDGSSNNIFKQYVNNPNGFAFSRISRVNYEKTFKQRFKNSAHLVSSAIFAKDLSLLWKTKRSFLICLSIPMGIVLNLYIKFKNYSNSINC